VNRFNTLTPALEKKLFSDESVPAPSSLDRFRLVKGGGDDQHTTRVVGLPQVAILLCTYDGQGYLRDQLDSFTRQTYSNWRVFASDDYSNDATHLILKDYQSEWGIERLSLRSGPAQGCTANFLSLICSSEIRSEYYAFSDQDDIWEADKLERAMAWFQTLPADKPALYCSRTRLVNADNQEIGLSPLFLKEPGFANALAQNIGGGNTMILNHAARELLAEASKDVDVVLHDWWAYIVVSGCGGEVFYDSYPALRYRQHDANLVGSGGGWYARTERIRKLWQGQWKEWNDKHLAALGIIRSRLTPENKKILDQFSSARKSSLVPRVVGIGRCGLYRQTRWGSLGLIAAAIFNKL
jgi:glycosyltransferase involved in cell wall biosynthesis